MSDLLVECPIHLDAVPIQDILVFRCGHGFCEPCLEEHFAHHGLNLSCPTCRKAVRRKEAFPLFLTPAQPGATQNNLPVAEASHTRLTRELKEARAAHANCPGRIVELQDEINTLRQASAHHKQTIHFLGNRYELSEEQCAKEAEKSARAREESNRMKEEVVKLQVENRKISKALEETTKDVQVQLERVKLFQCRIEQYKHKCDLEKKKRKAIESASHHPLPGKEDDSLMVVDANAPDLLHRDEPDFGWLDEACKVRGDQLAVPGDTDSELEGESEDDVQLSDPDTKGKSKGNQSETPLRFPSAWHLRPEGLGGPSSGINQKRGHGSRQVGERKLVKVKLSVGAGTHELVGGPLAIDRQGRIKRPVVLGSRQKLNSKN